MLDRAGSLPAAEARREVALGCVTHAIDRRDALACYPAALRHIVEMPELGGLGLREMGERLVDILTAGADDQLSRVAATVCLNGVLIAAQTHDDLTPDDLHLVLTKAGHSHPRPLTRIQEAPCPPSSTIWPAGACAVAAPCSPGGSWR